MRTLQYRVSLPRRLTSEALAFLEAIPGVYARTVPPQSTDPLPYCLGSTLYVPLDARGIVTAFLTQWRHTATWLTLPDTPFRIPRTVRDVPGINPKVLTKLYPHQEDAFPFLDAHDGGYLHWDTGTGKTLEATIFAASDPVPDRRVLVVTLPNTVYQWEAAIRVITLPGTFTPYILEGETAARAVPASEGGPSWVWLDPDPSRSYRSVFPRRRSLPDLTRPGDLPRADRRRLVDAGCLESAPALPGPRYIVRSTRTGETLATYDGREVALIPSRVRDAYAARAQATDVTQDPEAHVLIRPEGEDPADTAGALNVPLDTVLDIRAKALATLRAHAQRSTLDLPDGTDLVITSVAVLPARRDMLRQWAPTTVVLDEAHRFKSSDLYLSDVDGFGNERAILADNWPASAYAVAEQARRILLLSATPAPDAVRDWWSQLHILTRRFGRKRTFMDRYTGGHDSRVTSHLTVYDNSGISNGPELEARIAFWTHRVSKDAIREHLPKITREVLRIPPDRLARVTVTPAEWRAARAGGSIGLLELQVLIAAAMKRPFTAARILEHVSSKSDLKVIVLGGRQVDADLLGRDLTGRFPGDVWVAHGESHPDPRARFEIARRYRAHPGPVALIGTLDAWGTGVDGLQDSDRLMITHLPWSPGKLDQGEGRVDRPDDLSDLPWVPRRRGEPVLIGAPPPGSTHEGMGPRALRATTIEYLWATGTIDDRIGEVFLDKADAIGVTYGILRKRLADLHDALAGGLPEAARITALADRLLSGFPLDYDDED